MMSQGGVSKKYEDSKKGLRYSEHIGMLDFNNSGLERVIVSTRPSLEARDDPEILLPDNPPDAVDYEYIFHTHPPTPFPGARVNEGILFEFPSIDDLFHFSYHFNKGNTQGSIIIAPEGLYMINANVKTINIPDYNAIYKKMRDDILDIQLKAIAKYGDSFENKSNVFYGKVAQDTGYVAKYNAIMKRYWGNQLKVMYKPRKKDINGNWYIPSIYLPVQVTEPI